MPSLLPQLDIKGILLMYAADELSADDRRDVDRMLAADGKLRAQLVELRAAYEGTTEALRTADASQRLTLPAATAGRRVGNAVRAWHARRLASGRPVAGESKFRLPWWSYPIASAAAMVLACVGWWGLMGDSGPAGLPAIPMVASTYPSPEQPSTMPGDVVWTTGPWERNPLLHDVGDAALDDAEDELYALAAAADDASSLHLLTSETDEQ